MASNKESGSTIRVNFGVEETKTLLEIWGEEEVQALFQDKKTRKKVVWEGVSSRMFVMGYKRTSNECENRVKNLKKEYNKIRKGQKAGCGTTEWPYWNLIDGVQQRGPLDDSDAVHHHEPVDDNVLVFDSLQLQYDKSPEGSVHEQTGDEARVNHSDLVWTAPTLAHISSGRESIASNRSSTGKRSVKRHVSEDENSSEEDAITACGSGDNAVQKGSSAVQNDAKMKSERSGTHNLSRLKRFRRQVIDNETINQLIDIENRRLKQEEAMAALEERRDAREQKQDEREAERHEMEMECFRAIVAMAESLQSQQASMGRLQKETGSTMPIANATGQGLRIVRQLRSPATAANSNLSNRPGVVYVMSAKNMKSSQS